MPLKSANSQLLAARLLVLFIKNSRERVKDLTADGGSGHPDALENHADSVARRLDDADCLVIVLLLELIREFNEIQSLLANVCHSARG